jgi:hypothetical protein
MLARVAVSLASLALVACSGAPGEDVATSAEEALSVRHVGSITTISYAPNSFVIGNAYPGWTDLIQGNAQFSAGPGNYGGAFYRWGFLYGEGFDRCAWVNDAEIGSGAHQAGAHCASPQQIDDGFFFSTFTNGEHNQLAGDGSDTRMHYTGSGCTDRHGYGNVEPWRVPATPNNDVGVVPDGKLLKWRYVSRDGHWVLVRDPAPPPAAPNWYFVHRGCVSVANLH